MSYLHFIISTTRFQNRLLSAIAVLLCCSILSSCKKDEEPLSDLAGLTAFSLQGLDEIDFTIDQSGLKIQNADSLPFQTDVSSVVAEFQAISNTTVRVNGIIQESGITANNFSNPVTYDVTAENGVTIKSYTVTVNVAQVDPKTVSWQQVTADGGWGTYNTSIAGVFQENLWLFGASIGSFGAFDHGAFSSTDGATWNAITPTDNEGNPIPYAQYQALVSDFQDKLWLLGGRVPGNASSFDYVSNQVWSTSDGTSWTVTPHVQSPAEGEMWKGRQRINAVVFKAKLWVIGGNDYPSFGNDRYTGTPFNDVWSSEDGENWTQVTASAAFTARSNPAVFVYKDKIWVVGGVDNGGNPLNEVWNSEDGVTWTQVTSSQPFTPRWGHEAIVYDEQIFLLGGENKTDILNDLWVSEDDGLTWTKIESGDPRALPDNFAARTQFSFFVHDNTIWIIGGMGSKDEFGLYGNHLNDVWKGALLKP